MAVVVVVVERQQDLLFVVVVVDADLPTLDLTTSMFLKRNLLSDRLGVVAGILLVAIIVEPFLTMLVVVLIFSRGRDIRIALTLVRPEHEKVAQPRNNVGQERGAEAADQLVEQTQVCDEDAANEDRQEEPHSGKDVLRVRGESVSVFMAEDFVQCCAGWVKLEKARYRVRMDQKTVSISESHLCLTSIHCPMFENKKSAYSLRECQEHGEA